MVMLLSCNIYQDYCCCCFVVNVVVVVGVGVGAIHNLGDFKTAPDAPPTVYPHQTYRVFTHSQLIYHLIPLKYKTGLRSKRNKKNCLNIYHCCVCGKTKVSFLWIQTHNERTNKNKLETIISDVHL